MHMHTKYLSWDATITIRLLFQWLILGNLQTSSLAAIFEVKLS